MKYLFLILCLLPVFIFGQTSTGYKAPSATGEDYNTWGNPGNAYANDAAYADAIYSILPASQDYYNFSLSIPVGATINGIEVFTVVYQNDGNPYNAWITAELSWDGGNNYTTSSYKDSTSIAYTNDTLILGGSDSLWGGSWDYTDFSNTNFRLRLTFTDEDTDGPPWYSYLDYVAVNVYYTTSGGTYSPSIALYRDTSDMIPYRSGAWVYYRQRGAVTIDSTGYYFDSNYGSDANDGSYDNPFQSMTVAQAILDSMTVIRPIYLKRGSRWDKVQLNLDNANSGVSGSHFKIAAYGAGADPILTGWKDISGSGWSNSGLHWYKTDAEMPSTMNISVRATATQAWTFQEILPFVFISGVPYNVAKYPNAPRTYLDVAGYSADGYSYFDCATNFANDYWAGAEVLMNCSNWGMTRRTVSSYTTGRFYLTAGSYGADAERFTYDGAERLRFFITNHTNAQDLPGEWVYNYSTKTIDILGPSQPQNVFVPVKDYVIKLDNCDYVDISGLDIRAGIIAGIYTYQGDSVSITDCTVRFSGHAGILIGDGNDITVDGCYVRYCANNGIKSMSSSEVVVENCTVHNIGIQEGMGGDLANGDYEGVHSLYRDNAGSFTMQYCDIDSIGYNGLSVQGLLGTEGDVLVYKNVIQHTNYQLTDGGLIYVNLDTVGVSTARTKIIRGNLLRESWGNINFNNRGYNQSVGIYLDNETGSYTLDSNTVYKAPRAVWYNESQRYIDVNNNLLVDFNENFASGSERTGAYWPTASAGGDTPFPYKNEFNYNTVVAASATEVMQYLYYASPFDNFGNTVNNNKYHNGYSPSSFATTRLYGAYTEYPYTFAGWKTLTGYDAGSSYNANGQAYSTSMSITADQFVWVFSNWSDASHDFSLAGATFEDIDGTEKTSSLTLGAYESKVLFYKSGSILGISEPFYNP